MTNPDQLHAAKDAVEGYLRSYVARSAEPVTDMRNAEVEPEAA